MTEWHRGRNAGLVSGFDSWFWLRSVVCDGVAWAVLLDFRPVDRLGGVRVGEGCSNGESIKDVFECSIVHTPSLS